MNRFFYALAFSPLLVSGFSLGSSEAQDSFGAINQLRSEVYQLRNEVYGLRQQIYNSQTATGTTSNQISANLEVRISNVEQELRKLTGLMEQYQYQQNQLNNRLTALEQSASIASKPKVQTQPSQPLTDAQNSSSEQPSFVSVPVPSPRPSTEISTTSHADAEVAYQQAIDLVQASNYDAAEKAFRQFLEGHPGHSLTANAFYWLGESHYARGQMAQASVAFAKGFQRDPEGAKAPDNLLKLGMSLYQSGDKNQACTTLNALLDNYPNASVNILERSLSEQARMACP